MRTNRAKHRVAVAVTPQAPIFELAVPCEVFGVDRSEIAEPWYDFQICSAEPNTTVAAGSTVGGAGTLDDLVTADTVIVPASEYVHDEPPADLIAALRDAHRAGARLVSICSGAFVLAATGLLDGRRAITHWMHADELARRFPRVTVDADGLYVEDGGIFTSAGTAAGIDLCLELVRRDHGGAVANEVARRMVVPPHRDGGQAQYVRMPLAPHAGDGLAPVLAWARANLHRPITLDDLAQQAHTSRRTLIRRFRDTAGTPPLRWLQHERVRRAQDLLETTTLPVDRVAERAGLGTATNLRRYFIEYVGVSPHAYRQTFRVA